MSMAFYFPGFHAHFNKPFAVELYDFLSCTMLFGNRYPSMPPKDQHRHSASKAITDDYSIVHVMSNSKLLKFAEFATHGASTIGFRLT